MSNHLVAMVIVERFVGKIVMMKKKAFEDNVDVCLMIHPSAHDLNVGPMTAVQDVTVEFRGKPSMFWYDGNPLYAN